MKNLNRLIADVKKTAKANGIKVKLTPHKKVRIRGGYCSGYFDSEILLVATGAKKKHWAYVFVHESCHMDQMLEGVSFWEDSDQALQDFDSWISDEITLTKAKQIHMIETIQNMERDCEKRTIKKILKYDLPIDVEEYAQLANIYLYSYVFMRDYKVWRSFTGIQHELKKYVKKKINSSHKRIPAGLYTKFKEHAKIDTH